MTEKRLKGNLDRIDEHGIRGWVIDESNPFDPIELSVFIDNELVVTTIANIFREDLLTAGFGSGRCAFHIPLPDQLFDGEAHKVEIKDIASGFAFSTTYKKVWRTSQLEPKKMAQSRLSSSQSYVWLDITDLVAFVRHNSRVSGIQRVEAGLLVNILANKTNLEFKFCMMEEDVSDCYFEIPSSQLKAILMALESVGEMNSEDWSNSLREITSVEGNLEVIFCRQDYLVVLGAFWVYKAMPRLLIKTKREGKVKIIKVIYDLIPLLRPDFVPKETAFTFSTALLSLLPYIDGFLPISKFTKNELLNLCVQQNISCLPPVIEFLMGTDLSYSNSQVHESQDKVVAKIVDKVLNNKFVLFVGTIEIRKNHVYGLRIWERLIKKYDKDDIPNLVFVGRKGWSVDDFFVQLDATGNLDGKVVILTDVSDYELKKLYQNCLFTIYPSMYEGWGLPVSESLNYGKVCVASNATSVPEAGGNFAIYVDPYDLNSGYCEVEKLIFNPSVLKEHETRICELYRPVSWKEATASFLDALNTILAQTSTDSFSFQETDVANLLPVPMAKLGVRYQFGTKQNAEKTLKLSQIERWQNHAFCLQFLQKDWREIGIQEAWSKGKSADLAFSFLAEDVPENLLAYFELKIPKHLSCTLTISINNECIAEWNIISSGELIYKVAELKKAKAVKIANDELVFGLQINITNIVIQQPVGKKAKMVSVLSDSINIGVRSMTLISSSDVLQRIRMLEFLSGVGTIQ